MASRVNGTGEIEGDGAEWRRDEDSVVGTSLSDQNFSLFVLF